MLPAGGTVAFPGSCGWPTSTASSIACSSNITRAVVPGRFFGHPQHVRVAFGMGAEELSRGLDAVAAALDAAARLETARR